MKRVFVTMVCLNVFACLHAQGITLLYKNDRGWNDPLSWIQINIPATQTPIQRVPTELDDIVISSSLSGLPSVAFSSDNQNPDFYIGSNNSSGYRCKSMHVSNTTLYFESSFYVDASPTINVYTNNGGFVLIDSSSNLMHGRLALHGGNAAITDLQIINSTYGTLFSHADWTDIVWDNNARLKMVHSTMGGYRFAGDSGGNIFIDSSTIETNYFILGDNCTATLLNSRVTNNGNNNYLKFLVGHNSNFVSDKDTIISYSHLEFTTSGLEFNGEVRCLGQGPGWVDFVQEDPANALPNIINGSFGASELSVSLGISGDLKISGDFSGFSDDFFNNPAHVFVNGGDVFSLAGVTNYQHTVAINNCINDFCHYKLEFFGSTNSRISWIGGFPVDTLIINKSGCAKVTCDSSLYVSGATRINSGQLELDPDDTIPYKFVCAGNVDIAQGGGLFLRRDAAGVVANMAIGGTLTDHNSSRDSTCAGLSNAYNGVITFIMLFYLLTFLIFMDSIKTNQLLLPGAPQMKSIQKTLQLKNALISDRLSRLQMLQQTAICRAMRFTNISITLL